MSANLVRVGGGLAATLGGVLGVITSLLIFVLVLPRLLTQPQTVPSSGIVILTGILLILTWVLISGGLVGLYTSQREALGALGMVGFVLALVGSLLTVVVACAQTYAGGVSNGAVAGAAWIAVLGASIGWFLFGQATYQAGIYPRAAAILLMVGAVIYLLIHLSAGEVIVMAVAIAWLGLFLLRGRVSSAEYSPHASEREVAIGGASVSDEDKTGEEKQILYDDGLVQLDADGLTIRRYYFPLGTSKRIPYAQIKGVQERRMGPLTGKGRLWGSGDFVHWFPLDRRRSQKEKALVLDVGKSVIPVITPDNPDRVLALLQERTSGR